jgi:hypothetical protein
MTRPVKGSVGEFENAMVREGSFSISAAMSFDELFSLEHTLMSCTMSGENDGRRCPESKLLSNLSLFHGNIRALLLSMCRQEEGFP